MKRIIGVTGGVGAGKSEVLEILKQEYGANVILTDQVAKDLMEPGREGYRQVAAFLGGEILNPDGSINRPKMASVIFAQEEKRLGVNRLIHPLVWEEVLRESKESQNPLQEVETALPEKQFRDICHEIWYVYTSEENRARRLAESRGYDEERTAGMIKRQASDEEFRAISHEVIDNNGSLDQTRLQIARLLSEQTAEESSQ